MVTGMSPKMLAAGVALVVLWAGPVRAQTAEHAEDVRRAQRSAYAIESATNGCPVLDADLLGWPGKLVRHCEYAMRDTTLGHPRAAVAYLLDVKPEVIAQWIEGACARLSVQQASCFATVLNSGRQNSGYMFAVSGNIIEDMDGPGQFKNFFFRNGMTVSFGQGLNGSAVELPIDRQRALALSPNDQIVGIPSGMTRFWRTRPAQFRDHFPDLGAPSGVSSAADRTLWLGIVQKEILAALRTGRNRLLEADLCANAPSVFGVGCTGEP
jgi:hypothetical protein